MRTTNTYTGFTLIEVLLYVALAAFVLTASAGLLIPIQEAETKAAARARVIGEGTYALSVVIDAIERADAVTSPGAGGSAAELELSMPDAADDPTVIFLSGDTLTIRRGGNEAALTQAPVSVSALSFDNRSRPSTPGTVRVSLTLSHAPTRPGDPNISRTLIGSGTLRQ